MGRSMFCTVPRELGGRHGSLRDRSTSTGQGGCCREQGMREYLYFPEALADATDRCLPGTQTGSSMGCGVDKAGGARIARGWRRCRT